MSAAPDFDQEDLIQDAFAGFRAAPLPPSTHSAAEVHSVVRHRRQAKFIIVAATAVLAAAVPLTANAFVGHGPAAQPGQSASPTVSAIESPSPSSSPSSASAPIANLTTTAGSLVTDGSDGTVTGTVEVTVRNAGPASIDQINLVFPLRAGFSATGDAKNTCTSTTTGLTCTRPAPAVNGSRTYTFQFTIVFPADLRPTVLAVPSGATDPLMADNTANITICTNGCFPEPEQTDVSISASKLVTNGSEGTVTGTTQITVRNRGPVVISKVSLAFLYTDRTRPSDAGWQDCANDTKYKIMRCVVPAPAIGASRTFTFEFTVDFLAQGGEVTVNALPDGRNDSVPADNSVKLTVCTNGC